MKEHIDERLTRAAKAEEKIFKLEKALERALEIIHDEYCGPGVKEHFSECEWNRDFLKDLGLL